MGDAIAAAVFVPQTPSGDETRRRLAGKSAHEVAKEFEAVLLAQVIGAMRKTVPDSGMVEASTSRKMLDGAFDQEVARSLAARGGLGIARQIVGQIERQAAAREAAAAAPAENHAIAPTGRRAPGVAGPGGAAAATTSRVLTHAAPGATVGASTTAVTSSATVRPVEGEVTSPFGMRSDPFTGEPRFHAGVDVAAARGTEIRAVADGEVVFSGWRRGGAGRTVEVRHANGLLTSYAHAERTLVRAGQRVVAGEVVATVGSSGRASGPHLHFSAVRNGQAVDPAGLLEQGRTAVGALARAEASR